MSGFDYGRDGMVAIATPQANPTVEAEMAILLPPRVLRVTTRLTSTAAAPEERLRDYLSRIGDAVRSFDTLRPGAFGFACTASSYLLDERGPVAEVETLIGVPVVTAAAAIGEELRLTDARRIALLSPYPPALGEAATAYWRAQGFDPVTLGRAGAVSGDTRGIYALHSKDAGAALDALGHLSVDAILITGTGMPSLPLIATPPAGAPPIISSNLALARALLRRLGLPPHDWRTALTAATTTGESQ